MTSSEARCKHLGPCGGKGSTDQRPQGRTVLRFTLFGTVGLAALGVHFGLVLALVPLGIAPLWANLFGFLAAFQVSYWGHRHWTFRAGSLRHGQTLPRFLVVAVCGFGLNESLYFLLLRHTTLDYRLALLIVLAIAAVSTYIFSRRWAFRNA